MMPDSKEWLRTDTTKEAFKSLEKLDATLSLIPTDVYQWKWAIIILHNCTQAFMVLALEGTNQVEVVRNRKTYLEWLLKFSKGEKVNCRLRNRIQNTQLNDFMGLYRRIKQTRNAKFIWSNTKFTSTKNQKNDLTLLNEYRNKFIHFLPCSWGIELSGLLNICTTVMAFIQFMISNGNFMYKFSDEEQVRVRDFAVSINNKLGAIGHGE